MYIVDVNEDVLFAGCHLKFHKDHFDNNEEFVGYCKGYTCCDLFLVCMSAH